MPWRTRTLWWNSISGPADTLRRVFLEAFLFCRDRHDRFRPNVHAPACKKRTLVALVAGPDCSSCYLPRSTFLLAQRSVCCQSLQIESCNCNLEAVKTPAVQAAGLYLPIHGGGEGYSISDAIQGDTLPSGQRPGHHWNAGGACLQRLRPQPSPQFQAHVTRGSSSAAFGRGRFTRRI